MNKIARTIDPVTGPLTREELAALVHAPVGHALRTIRKFDPQYGRQSGEKFTWKIKCQGQIYGTAYVEAADQKEADKIAGDLTDAQVDWGDGSDDFEILSVEPDSK